MPDFIGVFKVSIFDVIVSEEACYDFLLLRRACCGYDRIIKGSSLDD